MLPIAPIVPDLSEKIAEQDCILVAPPGAGKSTYLPLQLLKVMAFAKQQIIMLQPRQVAVRGIAHYLASQLGESPGETVGYQMRGEAKFSARSKLLIMTEGLLSARIQQDPELKGIGLIIFDEFHERSVYSDIALGLSIEVQQAFRNDLRLLVMSATLDIVPVKQLMHSAAVFESKGRAYPIEYIYRPLIKQTTLGAYQSAKAIYVKHIVNVIGEAVATHSGHILVFLQGAAQINSVFNALTSSVVSQQLIVKPLYGGLSTKAQLEAIKPVPKGIRKIVLATNIAETSLTIDGVTVVIDSGLEKVQSLNLARKASQLNEQMISKASSIQRAGRAGRQQAGVCYRLWSEQQQQFLIEKSLPQITQVDISPYLLSLLEWGSSFDELPLIDTPSKAQIDYALDNLRLFGFVDAQGIITNDGKVAAKLNTSPRLAKVALTNESNKATFKRPPAYIRALLTAVLEGKPLYHETNSLDIHMQLRYLLTQKNHLLHKEVKRCMPVIMKHNQYGASHESNDSAILSYIDSHDFAAFMLSVFPDRIGINRGDNSYILTNGVGVTFYAKPSEHGSIAMPEWIVCMDLAAKGKTVGSQSRQFKSANANSLANNEIRLYFAVPSKVMDAYVIEHAQSQIKLIWDEKLERVSARKVSSLQAISLAQQTIPLLEAMSLNVNSQSQLVAILLLQIRKRGLSTFLSKATQFINRVALAANVSNDTSLNLPEMSISGLESTMEDWLSPYLQDISTLQQLVTLDWQSIIKTMLKWDQQQYIDTHFPNYFIAPTGNKHKLNYKLNGDVELAIRLQELYGLNDTPKLGQGKQLVTLSLLSPAHREIQKTKDLEGFWKGSYKDVQKEMKGRYPKHFWPDSPATSQATTKTKKHM